MSRPIGADALIESLQAQLAEYDEIAAEYRGWQQGRKDTMQAYGIKEEQR